MKGYSILETLIYSAILALIAALSVASIISSWKGLQKSRVEGGLASNGEFVLERITRDIRLAENVGLGSLFSASPGVLELVFASTTVKYSVSGQTIQRQEGSAGPENLTSLNARDLSLTFWQETVFSSKVSSRIVKIEFTLESGEGNLVKQKKFFGSAVLRGEY